MLAEPLVGRQDRRPQAVADYTQGGLTNDPLSYTRKLHHIDGRDLADFDSRADPVYPDDGWH
jgi:hypothetical protein